MFFLDIYRGLIVFWCFLDGNLKPVCPLFLGWKTLQNKAFSNKNKGPHLGSRELDPMGANHWLTFEDLEGISKHSKEENAFFWVYHTLKLSFARKQEVQKLLKSHEAKQFQQPIVDMLHTLDILAHSS